MTTFIPRRSYSQEEIDKLYPKELELQLVQIVGHAYINIAKYQFLLDLGTDDFGSSCVMANDHRYRPASKM
jgi:hypothetical protein